MHNASGTPRQWPQVAVGGACYDPGQPVPLHGSSRQAAACRQNQRQRRSQILATIRRLLTEEGFNAVTVRRIAAASGHAVQTIYNLVGPRNEAIVEAISEYTRYVGRTAQPDPDNPHAVLDLVRSWIGSIEASPEFCRQVSLIFFTPSRDIFYEFRDRQLKCMKNLLIRQQKGGILRSDVNVADLADQLVLFASAECLEWADRPFALDLLHRRLCSGYGNVMAGALNPHRGLIRTDPAPRSWSLVS